MPKMTLYPNGIVAANPPRRTNPSPSRRDKITGWTAGSARRNDLFLRSIDFAAVEALGLHGWASTLTLRTAPATAEDFKKRFRRFLKKMTDSGAQLVHYVIEMQPRPNSPTGPVPHVHLVAFFTHPYGPHRMGPRGPVGGPGYIWGFWSGCFPEFEPYPISQHITPITDITGWAQYVAKHGARSEQHYQRLRGLLPIGWHKIGRVWGKIGEWPVKSETHHLSRRAFFALRRFATRLLVAEARRSIPRLELRLAGSANEKQAAKNRRMLLQARRRVLYLKSRLKRNSARVGQVVPVSDWIDVSALRRWLRDACVERERIDPETGEVTSIWFLDGEETPPQPAPPFSQHFDATVPGGVPR